MLFFSMLGKSTGLEFKDTACMVVYSSDPCSIEPARISGLSKPAVILNVFPLWITKKPAPKLATYLTMAL